VLQLHIAACCGYTRVVQFLISHKVQLSVVDNDSWQPIHCAGYWAQVCTQFDIFCSCALHCCVFAVVYFLTFLWTTISLMGSYEPCWLLWSERSCGVSFM